MKLGLLAIGGALLNYRKAKAEYEALKEKQETLQAAVDTYNLEKTDQYDKRYNGKPEDIEYGIDVPENIRPDDGGNGEWKASTVLKVGNLVGKFMRMHGSIVFTNLTNDPIKIINVRIKWQILNYPVVIVGGSVTTIKEENISFEQKVLANVVVQPNETKEIEFDKCIATYLDENGFNMDAIRDIVCQAAGKKLITSCPKISIEDVETASFEVDWHKDDPNILNYNTYYTNGKPGVLRYCGEAFYG